MVTLLAPLVALLPLLAPALAFADAPLVPKPAGAMRAIAASYASLPFQFESNRGQVDPNVKFVARGDGYTLFLTPAEALLVLSERTANAEARAMLRMSIVGGDPRARVVGLSPAPGKSHYLVGRDPRSWSRDIVRYQQVAYREIYPGIDLMFRGSGGQLEFDFVVEPRSDTDAIRLRFDGVEQVALADDGALVLRTPGGQIVQHAPVAFQEIDGVRRSVGSGYVLHGAREVGFRLDGYDRDRPLTIDPVLSYASFLGGADDWNSDDAYGIAVDASGNVYIAGTTLAVAFPTVNAFQPDLSPGRCGTSFPNTPIPCQDLFVAKLSPDGATLLYSTYLGGGDSERVRGIAVDADGNAYLTGETSSTNFPTTPGAFQTLRAGGSDAFVVKLAPDGSHLVYSTYLGGTGACCDLGNAIAIDSAGNAYVTGAGDSPDFPTLHPVQGSFAGFVDAFVTKLDPSGSALVYSTYLGGLAADQGLAIAVDAAGSAYVSGFTGSLDFPIENALQPAFGGVFDAFVAKFAPDGSSLSYSTYLGGESNEWASSVGVDREGHAYVAGPTFSTDFPVSQGALQPVFAGGGADAFISKLAPGGSSLRYSTYLGGEGTDIAASIALVDDVAVVAGATGSDAFPTRKALQQARAGQDDVFVAAIDASGSELLFSTYLGGSGSESAAALAVDAAAGIHVAGWSNSSDFPTVNPLQSTLAGYRDAFVARLDDVIPTQLEVDIDIRPRKTRNEIPLRSHGVVRVAILGSDAFDVADVDPSTLAFGPASAAPVHPNLRPRDVNGDGRKDLVSRYRIQATGIAAGDTSACLTGETLDGRPFDGCDAIVTRPPDPRR
ncbi:MAG TPA: SBBP repeat-containing protein [Myxococcota bacterium]